MPPPCLFGGFGGPFEKWWPDPLLYTTIFKRVLDTIQIKICHLKGGNKQQSTKRFYSNGLDIEGLKLLNETN